jgi:lipoate-protein ligase A
MLCLDLISADPAFNLAAEEYLLLNSEEEYFMLYIDSPSVIIGKHQVAHRETNTEYVTGNKIPVIRRISGGGTVYHDNGNLNFSFILNSSSGNQVNFRKYSLPVLEFLSSVGIEAEFEGKSNLRINGKKISGNAEHVYRERVLHHGTLLFNSDLDKLKASLRDDTSHYSTRAVSSNPAHIINLAELLPSEPGINSFKELMLDFFLQKKGNILSKLKTEDLDQIDKIAENRYRTWDWNYAYGPEYSFKNGLQKNGEHIKLKLAVKDGLITDCQIEGSGNILRAAVKLKGCRHMPDDIREVLRQEEIQIHEPDVFRFF